MQSFDNSAERENPATSGNDLGKLRENCAPADESPRTYRFGEYEVDPAARRLLLQGQPVALRNRPFEVLLYLLTHRGRLVEQSELLAAIWGASDVYHDALRKAVGSIRAALGDDSQQPRFIETRWGRGYRFIGEVVETQASPAAPSVAQSAPGPILTQAAAPEAHWREVPARYATIAAGIVIAALFAATAIVARSHRPPTPPTQPLDRPAAVSPAQASHEEARRARYHEAQYLLSQRRSETIAQAIERFEGIVRSDPHSGDAYAALAECYALGYWGFWKIDPDLAAQISAQYAEKAVSVDASSAYAHAQLAAALFRQLRVSEAELEFERALALNPGDAEVHHAYAVFLDDTHRADLGIEEMKRAIELEPLSLAYKTDLGMSYFYAKRYADAIAVYHSVLTLDPDYIEAHEYLASMYVFQAQWSNARSEYAVVDRLRGRQGGTYNSSPLRVITQFRTGDNKQARAGLAALLASPSAMHSYALAKIYAQLGRPEDALRYLRQVVNSRSPEMFALADDPLLTPLHGDPDFQTLANRVSVLFTSTARSHPAPAIPAKLDGNGIGPQSSENVAFALSR